MNHKKVLRTVADIFADILFAATCLFLLWLFCLMFVYATFTIPTDSMQPGIKPGDVVFVEKVSTGARIFNIFAAANGDTVKVRRMPGWRKFRRNDVLVFNFVHRNSWDTIEMNIRKYYIKRCVAAPGDTIAIEGFVYKVNGEPLLRYPSPAEFSLYYPDDSVGRSERRRGYMADLSDSIDNWTIRDFGPLTVPARDTLVPIDTITFRRYRQLIEHETGKKVACRDGLVTLGDSAITSYRFKNNYYFMAGDNAVYSMDSRYWGLVPEEFIVGKADFIIWSKTRKGIQWKRLFNAVK